MKNEEHIPTQEKEDTFKTGVNLVKRKRETELPPIEDKTQLKNQTFFEAKLPTYDETRLSFSIPVDLVKIKKNASNCLFKVKFNLLFTNVALNELVDALISDSFWFLVCFFQTHNKVGDHKDDELGVILKRMSCNYFKFFIRICDMGPSKKNDPVLNGFRDFMSQCVYYSIYLAFPKSRYLFGEELRQRIVILFSYLFNGLISDNTFSALHWELDLGKGNIIENYTNKYKDEQELKLPDLNELKALLERNFIRKKYAKKKTTAFRMKKDEINNEILNTPLYRLYADTNKFETMNLLKPIKISTRKIIDIYQVAKQHANYVKFAKETLRNVVDRKIQVDKELSEKEAEFQNQINEVKQNENRIRKELQDIKIQRVQEYANYCIFISSK